MGYSSYSGYGARAASSGFDSFIMVLLVVAVIAGSVCAIICSKIAEEKGYESTIYAMFGFFFSAIALAAVVAMPNAKAEREILDELKKANRMRGIDELAKCRELMEAGIMDQEEFEEIKRRVMSEYGQLNAAQQEATAAQKPRRPEPPQSPTPATSPEPATLAPAQPATPALVYLAPRQDGRVDVTVFMDGRRVAYGRQFVNTGGRETKAFCAEVADRVEFDLCRPVKYSISEPPAELG